MICRKELLDPFIHVIRGTEKLLIVLHTQ